MAILISLASVACFVLALWLTKLPSVARRCLSLVETAIAAILNPDLDDRTKEKTLVNAGYRLLLLAIGAFCLLALALGLASLPVIVADFFGITPREAVISLLLSWQYLVVVSLALLIVGLLLKRYHQTSRNASIASSGYSFADRMLHYFAFSHQVVLRAVSALEDILVPRSLAVTDAPPIFVTSLARGGTTAILNALCASPTLASHTYRDMPFITAPTLWGHLSGGARRSVSPRKRAHGDGLVIDLDSPEALEEVVWKMHWPKMYRERSITQWTDRHHNSASEVFMHQHQRKIIAARRSHRPIGKLQPTRYCSKNNANIARLSYLLRVFPDCQLVVPVRRPERHAASLLNQHKNFIQLHDEDEFTSRYMRDIGHFDFGRDHKYIEFAGFDPELYSSLTGDYWLAYWLSAFEEIIKHRTECIFVLQDDLRSAPQKTIERLYQQLGLDLIDVDFSHYFISKPDTEDSNNIGSHISFDAELMKTARDLYQQLTELARA